MGLGLGLAQRVPQGHGSSWAGIVARAEGRGSHLDHNWGVAATAVKVEAAEVDATKRPAGVVRRPTLVRARARASVGVRVWVRVWVGATLHSTPSLTCSGKGLRRAQP